MKQYNHDIAVGADTRLQVTGTTHYDVHLAFHASSVTKADDKMTEWENAGFTNIWCYYCASRNGYIVTGKPPMTEVK